MTAPAERHPFGSLTTYAQRILLAVGVAAAVALLLLALWYAAHALLMAFAGVLLAILLRAPADWLSARTGLAERWCLVMVLVVLLSAVVGFGFVVAPQISAQFQQLAQKLPQSIQHVQDELERSAWGAWLLNLVPSPEQLQDGGGGFHPGGMASSAVQTLFDILVLLFVTLFLALNPRLYSNGLLRLVPREQRPRAAEVLGATGYTLRWWLVGTLIRMVAVGVMTFAGLWLLGVPLALVLAVLAFLLDFVPYFGPIIAAIPAILLGFTEGPQQALYVAALYFVVQQIESLLISPLLYERTVYLPPVVTILAQVVLFSMLGALGIVLATPLAAVGLVWVKMLYVEQVLGDSIRTPDEEVRADEVPPVPGPEGDGPRRPRSMHPTRSKHA